MAPGGVVLLSLATLVVGVCCGWALALVAVLRHSKAIDDAYRPIIQSEADYLREQEAYGD